ncbi:MAG: RHS repeat domain-containing protein, partial [Bacteroidota bacterium]
QSKDVNGNYASTKTDSQLESVFSVANAAYSEQFYSGAEDEVISGWYGGEVKHWNQVSDKAHTGNYSEKAGVGSKNFLTTPVPAKDGLRKYKLSVWVDKENATRAKVSVGAGLESFNGEKVYAGDWAQLNHYFDLNNAESNEVYVTVSSGIAYFDDFRVHPIQSKMISYVYNDRDELTNILNANNMGTHYEYDAAGRLARVYEEVINGRSLVGGFKLSQEYQQHYKRGYEPITEPDNDPLPINASIQISQVVCGGTPSVPLGDNERAVFGHVGNVTGGSGDYGYTWQWTQSTNWTSHHSTQPSMVLPFNPAISTFCDSTGQETIRVRCTITDLSDNTVAPLTLTSNYHNIYCGECIDGSGPEQ